MKITERCKYRVKSKEAYLNTPTICVEKRYSSLTYYVTECSSTAQQILGKIVTVFYQGIGETNLPLGSSVDLYTSSECGTNFINDSFEELIE